MPLPNLNIADICKLGKALLIKHANSWFLGKNASLREYLKD
jgi:hypothetical protein